jgi:nonspecific dipeptidase
MMDFISLMGCLVDKKGKKLIPSINDALVPVTDKECELYDHIGFDSEEFTKDMGMLQHSCKKDILMHRC